MPTILAGPRIGQNFTVYRGEPKRIIEFAIGEQPGVRSDYRPVKPERQSAVEIEPENAITCFTRRVRHDSLIRISVIR